MLTAITLKNSPENNHLKEGVIFISSKDEIDTLSLNLKDKTFVSLKLYEKNMDQVWLSNDAQRLLIIKQKDHSEESYKLEYARKAGSGVWSFLKDTDIPAVLYNGEAVHLLLAFIEGLMLASYSFQKYRSDKKNTPPTLEVISTKVRETSLLELEHKINATYEARTLVNEPTIFLTALQLSEEIKKLGIKYGFATESYDETQIASLKMEGLLAVNAGSELPPTFNTLHHKPKVPTTERPIVLVGKGVVYDTGGLSLKPTANSMDMMKSDMAGAAAVIGAICAAAKLALPIEIIGLIPATDNRPGYNAITPGDVITYPNGKSVEILNTDAEGRLILADALLFAKKYDPHLVIDVATLTGSAAAAIGKEGAVMMGNANDEQKQNLKQAGQEVFERLVEFPLWEEYDDQLKSTIADITNLGGSTGGAITAGKFLQHFVDFDWIHLDIAGPAYSKSGENYRTAGGSGFGVRLLTQFLCNISKQHDEH
ncbi:leucyl aminopeptidase family protein [Anditalea andensis]|uniref:Peptidase M17 n=1 Tax=Anditalea andensis TaxID=1048983 RepID=A0A074LM55_9BACT|nr:leucyl aminopeptidase [Anditalea andensis]KEO74967.1 peptidase M17 [Anditalea andensis]